MGVERKWRQVTCKTYKSPCFSSYTYCANLLPSYVLDQILSGSPLDDVIEKVCDYLQQLQKRINEGKVELPLFVITKVISQSSTWPRKRVGEAVMDERLLCVLYVGYVIGGEIVADLVHTVEGQ